MSTESYGLGIMTSNMILFLIVAVFWMWEAIVKRNDFTPIKPSLWKYWVETFLNRSKSESFTI